MKPDRATEERAADGSAKSRRRRAVRHAGARLSLTDRDWDLLELVGAARYVSVRHIALAFFPPGSDRATRRIRALYDAGFLRLTVTSSTEPALVSLSPDGLDALWDRLGDEDPRVGLAGAIPLGGVAHHLLLVSARLWAAGLAEVGKPRLLSWNSGSSEAAVAALGGAKVRPDSMAEFLLSSGNVMTAFVEGDTGTQRQGVIAGKASRYLPILTAAPRRELWFATAGSARREELLAAACRDAGIAGRTRIIGADVLHRRPCEVPARVDGSGAPSATRPKDSVP